MPVSRALLYISSRVPSKGAPCSRPSSLSPLWERRSAFGTPFIHLSKSLVDEPPSRFPIGAPMERDASLLSLFYICFRGPSKGAPPPGSPLGAPTERDDPFLEPPFNCLFKSLVEEPTPGCPAEPKSLPSITFRVPSKGAPLQVPLTELSLRKMLHSQSPPSAISRSSR